VNAYSFEYLCPGPLAVATLAPGLLNLVPAFWLLSRKARTQRAAAIATVLGACRVLVPVARYIHSGLDHEGLVNYQYNSFNGTNVPGFEVAPFLWGASVLLIVAYQVAVSLHDLAHRSVQRDHPSGG